METFTIYLLLNKCPYTVLPLLFDYRERNDRKHIGHSRMTLRFARMPMGGWADSWHSYRPESLTWAYLM